MNLKEHALFSLSCVIEFHSHVSICSRAEKLCSAIAIVNGMLRKIKVCVFQQANCLCLRFDKKNHEPW